MTRREWTKLVVMYAFILAINLAGFLTGGFIKDTGPAGNVAFSNVGVTYRF